MCDAPNNASGCSVKTPSGDDNNSSSASDIFLFNF